MFALKKFNWMHLLHFAFIAGAKAIIFLFCFSHRQLVY